jgi:hypothetical protein
MIPWALNSGLTNIAQSMMSIFRLTGLSNWLPQTMYQGPCAWSENPEHPLFVWKPRLPDPGSDYFNITTISSDGALDVRPTPAGITYFDPTDHYLTISGKNNRHCCSFGKTRSTRGAFEFAGSAQWWIFRDFRGSPACPMLVLLGLTNPLLSLRELYGSSSLQPLRGKQHALAMMVRAETAIAIVLISRQTGLFGFLCKTRLFYRRVNIFLQCLHYDDV